MSRSFCLAGIKKQTACKAGGLRKYAVQEVSASGGYTFFAAAAPALRPQCTVPMTAVPLPG